MQPRVLRRRGGTSTLTSRRLDSARRFGGRAPGRARRGGPRAATAGGLASGDRHQGASIGPRAAAERIAGQPRAKTGGHQSAGDAARYDPDTLHWRVGCCGVFCGPTLAVAHTRPARRTTPPALARETPRVSVGHRAGERRGRGEQASEAPNGWRLDGRHPGVTGAFRWPTPREGPQNRLRLRRRTCRDVGTGQRRHRRSCEATRPDVPSPEAAG